MKNYVIAAVVVILIIGGIVWSKGNQATPVDVSDTEVTTVVDVVTDVATTTTTTATTTDVDSTVVAE